MEQAGLNQTQGEKSMEETITAITAVKRNDSAEVVRGERYQSQDLLLSSAETPVEMRGISTGYRTFECTQMHIKHAY